jgi:chromosome partitioning protein
MKTIVVCSPRGGSGKSVLCVHLAVAAELRGDGPVALLDADPLGFALECCEVRRRRFLDTPQAEPATPKGVSEALAELESGGTRYTVLDTPPSITAGNLEMLRYGDLVLVPVDPTVPELRALRKALPAILAASRSIAFVWCRASKILRADHAAGLIELASLGSVFKANMRERAIYTEPFVHGYAAFEDKRNGDAASEDVFAIWAEVREKLGA